MKEEMIGISEYAKRIGKSKQTVYNWIKKGKLDCATYQRGTMNGLLIRVKDE